MFQIAIVEDEKEIALSLKEKVENVFLQQKKECELFLFGDGKDFINSKNNYDLILLDINMPHSNGLEIANLIREKNKDVIIIFVTSLMQYAIEGYKVRAFDFILKPVSDLSLRSVLERAIDYLTNKNATISITLNRNQIKIINIEELKYIEVIGHKLIFHCSKENYEIKGVLTSYTEELERHYFSLCNRCYLVNLKYVTEIDREYVLLNNEKLLLSRRRKVPFLNDLNAYLNRRCF